MEMRNGSRTGHEAKCRIYSGAIHYCAAPESLRLGPPAIPEIEAAKDPHFGPKSFHRTGAVKHGEAAPEATGK